MATYAGVTFTIRGDTALFPRWRQDAMVVERPIPYANYSDLQVAGRGNFRLQVDAIVTADPDVATLQAAVGTTLRTLTNPFGDSVNYSNVALVSVGAPTRAWKSAWWVIPLTFIRKGS